MNNQASYYIDGFLKQYSEKTRKEYKRDIDEFYKYQYEYSNYEELTVDQLFEKEKDIKFSKIDVINYRAYLSDSNNKNSEGTIKRKLYTMRSLFKFLQGEGFITNPDIFDAKSIKYTPDSYDPLTKQQALELADYIKNNHSRGEEMFSYIIVAIATSIRINALCSIEYSDITYNQDEDVYLITTRNVREKMGKIASMPIYPWMYEMLLLNKVEGSDKVFPNLNQDYIHYAITTCAPKIGLTGRITPHSLRKVAAVHEMKTRGNVQMGMKQLGHSNASTFIGSYSKYTINNKDMAGMRMFTEVDDSIFDNVSKEQILQALKMFNMTAYEQVAFAVLDKKV